MELSSKILEQVPFNTRPKVEEHILVVINKSTHEEHLAQPFQTNDKQFKIAITFCSCYNGIFNVTNTNIKFFSKKTLIEEDFVQVTTPPSTYEIESLNDENKRNINMKEYYRENEYPFTIKPYFSTLGSIIEKQLRGPIISFASDDSIRNYLRFRETLLYKE